MIRIRLMFAILGLSFVVSLMLAPPAAADNCDIFTNPGDCQNTAWTIGVIATLAGGVAVATIATAESRKKSDGAERRKSPTRTPPGFWMFWMSSRPQREREQREATGDVDIRPVADPPTVTIQPPSGIIFSHSVTLEAHHDPGRQTAQEVDRGFP